MLIAHICVYEILNVYGVFDVTRIRNIKLLKRFGKRLRDLRIENNLSQEALANEAEVPISQIGRIERGEVNATLSTLHALSSALKISLPRLLEF
jgi:ribosome-binding protein aMBF1 (putative translation factor)